MKTEIKIIKTLLADRTASFTIRGLAKMADLDYKIVHTAVQLLFKKGVLDKKKIGSSTSIKLSGDLTSEVVLAELERRESLLRNSDFSAIYDKIAALKFPFIALIFGSCAKGGARRGSDIDIMVLCEKGRERSLENSISILPLNIHLVPLTFDEFTTMAKSREFTVVSEVLKTNVILVGIEDFYRLVGHHV